MTQTIPNDRPRLTVAQEAARIMADHGISDFQVAKRKAAARLGLDDSGALPTNLEVEAALIEHHRLYSESDHDNLIHQRRTTVLSLMEAVPQFEPRLVGPLLAGTAADDSPANLHLFTDSAEDFMWFLDEQRIDYKPFERRVRIRRGQSAGFPAFRFEWTDVLVEATVFPFDGLRQAPLSPVDAKPMRRASIKKVKKLVAR